MRKGLAEVNGLLTISWCRRAKLKEANYTYHKWIFHMKNNRAHHVRIFQLNIIQFQKKNNLSMFER